MVKGIKIGMSNKSFYSLIVIGVLILVGSVYAYGTSSPSVMGHSVGELNMGPIRVSGNSVGIGTSSPMHDLDIVNPSGPANINIYANPSHSSSVTFLTSRAGSGVLGQSSAAGWIMYGRGVSYAAEPHTFGMNFWNGANWLPHTPLRIDPASGYVGIGQLPRMGVGAGPVYWVGAPGWLTAINPSSREYKENIEPMPKLKEERIFDLELKSFTWKEDQQNDFGYIAEEVQNVLPELYEEDEHVTGYQKDKLIFYVIELVKSQQEQIDKLEKDNEELRDFLYRE